MSSEVCPFCGKTFKRLKSHLPHCKAAANSQTPPTTQDATVLSKTTTKEKKPKQLSPMATDQPPKKSKKVSAHASQSEQLATAASSGLASTLMANKKKQKKLKETASSASPSSALPKPEKKSLRTLIEEAKPVANVKETKSASKDSSLSKSSNHTESKVAPESFHDVFSGNKVKKQPKMKYVVCGWNPLDSNVGPDQSSLRRIKENVWVDGDGEDMEGLTDIGGHQGKVTLQDVKSTLGRTTSRRQSSILSRITAADQMKLDVDPSPLPLPVETQKQETTQSDKQLSVKESGAPPSVQHQLLSSAAQGGRSRLAEPLLSAPSNQPSSHLQFPRMVEDLQLDVRRQNQLIEGLATRRHVGQVRLKELPDWLLSRTPRRPRDAVEMMQRGWLWYYRRYIDVKKGGVGGLSMLLAGYCVLSYVWSYPHLKSSRWRKYH